MSGASLGPWGDARAARQTATVAGAATGGPSTPTQQPVGQNLVWALISTALLAGYLWYAMGWIYAFAGVIGIFVHEYGHVLAFNRLGMGPGRIFIVPFLGGAAAPRIPADTEMKDVLSSLAGPSFGLLAAIPFYLAFVATGQKVWLEGAWFIAVINLLNLLPAPPLDGSRALGPVLARIHPLMEKGALVLVGVAVVIWGVLSARTPMGFIFPVFIALAVIGHLRGGGWRPHARKLSWQGAGAAFGLYLGTLLLCACVFLFLTMSMGLAFDPPAATSAPTPTPSTGGTPV